MPRSEAKKYVITCMIDDDRVGYFYTNIESLCTYEQNFSGGTLLVFTGTIFVFVVVTFVVVLKNRLKQLTLYKRITLESFLYLFHVMPDC